MEDNLYTTVHDMNQRGFNLPNNEKAEVGITYFEGLGARQLNIKRHALITIYKTT